MKKMTQEQKRTLQTGLDYLSREDMEELLRDIMDMQVEDGYPSDKLAIVDLVQIHINTRNIIFKKIRERVSEVGRNLFGGSS